MQSGRNSCGTRSDEDDVGVPRQIGKIRKIKDKWDGIVWFKLKSLFLVRFGSAFA